MGHSRFTAFLQFSVSRCIHDVVKALNHPDIFNYWVKFPSNVYELDQVRKKFKKKNTLGFFIFLYLFIHKFRFYTLTGFPEIIGCVDCTHVSIVLPSSNLNLNENQHPEYIYVNRKCYYSINVQLVNITCNL